MTSIHERIAALKLDEVARQPGPVDAPPSRRAAQPSLPPRHHSTTSLRQTTHSVPTRIGNEPAAEAAPPKISRPPPPPPPRLHAPTAAPTLPPRNTAKRAPPPLPRRESATSISSTLSARSSASAPSSTWSSNTSASADSRTPEASEHTRVKAPAYDPSTLPALPPKRVEPDAKRPSLPSRTSTTRSVRPSSDTATVVSRRLPPESNRAISRQPAPHDAPEDPAVEDARQALPTPNPRTLPSRAVVHAEPQKQAVPERRPTKSALSFGMNRATETAPTIPSRSSESQAESSALPPPVPTSTRPDLSAILATKPKFNASTMSHGPPGSAPSSTPGVCLQCRDFSGPDSHAARFPRHALPSQDVHWLARALTSPFESRTDQARAIFTWLHHNVRYDVDGFFSGNIKPSTPSSTIASGLAVCEGYAGLFAALATAAGLSAIVIGGHGKGYGYAAGTPVPREPTGHAWNAVQIDDGEWKLIDPCWGAGVIGGEAQYEARFNAGEFTKSNRDFGLKHYPSHRSHLFLPAGEHAPSFAEYWRGADGEGDEVLAYGGCRTEHGIDEARLLPRQKAVPAMPGRTVRFELWSVCEHWDNAIHGRGKPYVMVLMYHGEMTAFETDGRRRWWCEVRSDALGAPGEAVSCMAVTTINGESARGVGIDEFRRRKGRAGMSWEGVCAWTVA